MLVFLVLLIVVVGMIALLLAPYAEPGEIKGPPENW